MWESIFRVNAKKKKYTENQLNNSLLTQNIFKYMFICGNSKQKNVSYLLNEIIEKKIKNIRNDTKKKKNKHHDNKDDEIV